MKKIVVMCAAQLLGAMTVCGQKTYLSPTHMAVDTQEGKGYVVLSTASALSQIDLDSEQVLNTIPLDFEPSDVCVSPDGKSLYITENKADGKLFIYATNTLKKKGNVSVGAYPFAVCVNAEGTKGWVANRFSNDLSVIDLNKKKEIARIPMVREPKSLALSPDGKILAVGNYLPSQASTDQTVSSVVTLVDTKTNHVIANVPLQDGSQSVEDVCFSKDGKVLFVSHLLSRYQYPTTQLERGWMNTNAVSIINVAKRKADRTFLLDDMYQGAANPCGLALSEDGEELYVALSGSHDLMIVSIMPILRDLMESDFLDPSNNLTYMNSYKKRVNLNAKGPRYIMVNDGKLFISDYFSGGLSVTDCKHPEKVRFVKLGEEPEMDDIRKGEMIFADGSLCFQKWQSCVSCHPGARADGLNWDQMNDGMGNPKNTKSMLYAHMTPPAMITGVRADAETAVRAGIKHILFAQFPETDNKCVDKYLSSIKELPSPYLEKGELSKSAQNGKKLFQQAGCADCHKGDYLTDGNKYNVETGIEEYDGASFDTPSLREIWRTAPYLYDGRAKTIKEVLTTFNKNDKHGKTSNLSEKEIADLETYVLSL